MHSFAHKKTENGLINRYQTNLERRIEKGDRSLICRDEELCKEVEALLCSNNALKIHNLHGLDSLTVMEKSLHAFPSKTGQMGLEKLSKAFEVLELAALNLYVFPWRREYRLVKMFSGMFTHLIKPALTLQQAKELFGLLGYQPSSPNEDEELTLTSKLAPTDFLLSLACGFFTARMECQLLLSALGSAHRGVEWVLQLVKERKAGHSLQVALENTKRKSEVASTSTPILTSGMDGELDLYTEQANVTSHMMSTTFSPPHSSYMPPKEITQSKPLQKEPIQSDIRNNEDASKRRSINTSGSMESFGDANSKEDVQRQAAVNVMCSCISPHSLYIYQCETCKDVHSTLCSFYKECSINGHTLALCNTKELYLTQDQLRLDKEKDTLKTHHCMVNSTSDSFLVCYDCQEIHDHNCNVIKKCNSKQHNVQPTGKLQPPQGERVNSQNRHRCLSSATPVDVICHTSNNSHDYLCKDWQSCVTNAHHTQFTQETDDSGTSCAPISVHESCLKAKESLPEIVCLTCKIFHHFACPVGWHCSQKHKIQDIGTKCVTCLGPELDTICRYCGTPYCKRCCFKNALLCKCGKSLIPSTSV
ncbi:spermatogenesis associated 2-like [Pseudorasbora parva]|uniref:spermatogenesis associated 2-like n=1 Tax=Pseudorasbora parva TaxID=51549 RepID=UPI00351E3A71